MTEVTRAEFTMLREQVTANLARLDAIDQSGTRGVGVVQQQLMDLKGDIAGLTVRMDKHEESHDKDERERRSARWRVVGAGIAALAAIEGPLAYLITHLH